METRPPSGDEPIDESEVVNPAQVEPTLFDDPHDQADNGTVAVVRPLRAVPTDVDVTERIDDVAPDETDEPTGAGAWEDAGDGEAPEHSEAAEECGELHNLNDVSALYHVLERRLRGAAKGWPDHRRAELDEVLRDRFSDFFVDLPEDAVARLTEVALGNDPLHQAS